MPQAARIGDNHTCPMYDGKSPHVGGPVSVGAPNVIIGGQPAARIGDMLICCGPPDVVAAGEPTVQIAGKPAARLGDRTAHGGVIVVGCPTVLIGSVAGGGCLCEAAQKGTPFVDMGRPAPSSEDASESESGLAPPPTANAAPHQEAENWIALQYYYSDGTGVGGAQYQVKDNKTQTVVAQGKLDANGYAKPTLPASITDVSYNFYNDPPTIEYRIKPTSNPENKQVKPGWFERVGDSVEWVWGALQGDFNENPTTGQIALNTVITMIPVVDQVADVRDLVANLRALIWDKRYDDKWVWIAILLTLVGCVPVVGSAIKGVLTTVVNYLKKGTKIPLKHLMEVLNKYHKGNAIQWLHQLVADMPKYAARVKQELHKILNALREKMHWMAENIPGRIGRQAKETENTIEHVSKIADQKIDEAAKELQDGLSKSLDEGVDFESKGATKSTNTRKQRESEAPKDETKAEQKNKHSTKTIGTCGERLARKDLEAEGFKEVAVVQNKSGQGIDLIGRNSKGEVKVWEVKATTTDTAPQLSKDQRDMGAENYVYDRLARAAKGQGNYSKLPEARKEARKALEWIYRTNKTQVTYQIYEVFIDDLDKGCMKRPGRKSRAKDWK
jgi:uncharacterized Zn-binding protein involved in type VI secretion